MPKNFVFYRGPSMLDGAPIVAIATIDSDNSKVGAMVQTWILRADVAPVAAARDGRDVSICGQCPHRGTYKDGLRLEGSRSCYVQLYVPENIWHTWQRGRYLDLTGNMPAAAAAVAGRMVRLGAYGDPAAVPFGVWQALLAQTSGHTGYTHQWRGFPEFAEYVMASCDSSTDRVHARALGFRTFRVAPAEGWARESGEILCPASAEAGKKTVCALCKACGGHSAKARADVMIPAHGGGRKLVTERAG